MECFSVIFQEILFLAPDLTSLLYTVTRTSNLPVLTIQEA